MLKSIFSAIGQGVRLLIRPLSGAIESWQRDRRRKEMIEQAYRLDLDGKYAAAAEIYASLAAEELHSNELIYARYSRDAIRMWLKAKDVEKALAQARSVLRVLGDAGWLNEPSSSSYDDLNQIVGDLYVAGYTSEAGDFSKEINAQRIAHGLAPAAASPGEAGKFPPVCPACGGPLHASEGQDEVKCPYCGAVVHST